MDGRLRAAGPAPFPGMRRFAPVAPGVFRGPQYLTVPSLWSHVARNGEPQFEKKAPKAQKVASRVDKTPTYKN